jgi:hypothetical protein
VRGLFSDTSETTDIVFISESPYNYPKKGVDSSEDFKAKELQPRFERNGSDAAPRPESKPKDIFEFIYNTFRPVFNATQKRAGQMYSCRVSTGLTLTRSHSKRNSSPIRHQSEESMENNAPVSFS